MTNSRPVRPFYRPMRPRVPTRRTAPRRRWSCSSTCASSSRSPRRRPPAPRPGRAATSAHGVVGYLMVFFAIWWAWMNFTWFASAYDTDDVPYRLVTLVQIAGVLVLAAGVPRAFDGSDFAVVTLGYVVMRLGDGRASGCGPRRATARRRADRAALRGRHQRRAGRLGRCAAGCPPDCRRRARSCVLVVARARRAGLGRAAPARPLAPAPHRRALRPVHPHRARRVGRSPRPSRSRRRSTSRRARRRPGADRRRRAGHRLRALVALLRPAGATACSTTLRTSFLWGYGHYVVFASAAAVGAGLAVAVEQAIGHAQISADADRPPSPSPPPSTSSASGCCTPAGSSTARWSSHSPSSRCWHCSHRSGRPRYTCSRRCSSRS